MTSARIGVKMADPAGDSLFMELKMPVIPLRWLTACALIAPLAMAAFAVMMTGRPVSGAEYAHVGLSNLAFVPTQRILSGALGGLLASALYVPAIWRMCRGLRPVGHALELAAFAFFGWMILVGAAQHVSMGFVGLAEHAMSEGAASARLLFDMERVNLALGRMGLIGLIGGSVTLVVGVMSGRSDYPRVYVLFAPLILVWPLNVVAEALPAPYGGIAAPAVFHTTMALTLLGGICMESRVAVRARALALR